MLDHFGLSAPASSFHDILKFYDAALAPLHYKRKDFIPDQLVGYAADGVNYDFWIHKKDDGPRQPSHFAFRAESHDQVDQFHAQGVTAGGSDNGKPGIREIYHPSYYGAFVKDPCGQVKCRKASMVESNMA
ncbi:hypothetical protein OPT61_g556 [Boeremia exigua]|uniref:Uncharacterized protein n=1 Tax=Boeremia exigua TaxID=749465 RepID=A0ACC2ITG3_9PLEO|nr:hypothetical protein OPT61_g556 [Boeremia exigua]